MNFTSDNNWSAWPEILDAVSRSAEGAELSYGDDRITARVRERFSEIFERSVEVFPVITGTAANALALATLVPQHGAIFCHANSHIAVDECGAVEFFTHGAKLVTLEGAHGKLSPETVRRALGHFQRGLVHHAQPAAISIAQATERGTVYQPDEVAILAALARENGMKLHMDGARFANAAASLGCSAAELSWRAGVDVLCFGATKGGALGAEAVIFFDKNDARDFAFRRKKAGHLLSKMRFVSAQLEVYLADGRWLHHAAHANRQAGKLAAGLASIAGVALTDPVEANSIFVRVPDGMAARLRTAGAKFYDWEPPAKGSTVIRLVTSFATTDADVARFLEVAAG